MSGRSPARPGIHSSAPSAALWGSRSCRCLFQPRQKRSEVDRVEQGLLAEFDRRELAAADGRVQGCSPDTEHLDRLADPIGGLHQTERVRIDENRIGSRAMELLGHDIQVRILLPAGTMTIRHGHTVPHLSGRTTRRFSSDSTLAHAHALLLVDGRAGDEERLMGDHITLHLSFGACRACAGPLEPIGQAPEPARTSPEARGLDGSPRPGRVAGKDRRRSNAACSNAGRQSRVLRHTGMICLNRRQKLEPLSALNFERLGWSRMQRFLSSASSFLCATAPQAFLRPDRNFPSRRRRRRRQGRPAQGPHGGGNNAA